ncbi:hypothetical protein LY76DRAFT_314123 [Colletotrichum caudatum]|nr:hypothetical protein LY76DRAFT_314123 [Colletotrichum caudatum]
MRRAPGNPPIWPTVHLPKLERLLTDNEAVTPVRIPPFDGFHAMSSKCFLPWEPPASKHTRLSEPQNGSLSLSLSLIVHSNPQRGSDERRKKLLEKSKKKVLCSDSNPKSDLWLTALSPAFICTAHSSTYDFVTGQEPRTARPSAKNHEQELEAPPPRVFRSRRASLSLSLYFRRKAGSS